MNIFQKKTYMIFFAICAMFSWSLAFPFIKLGMIAFQIGPKDTDEKILFAGIRFFLAGIFTLVFAKFLKKDIRIHKSTDFAWVVLLALVNTSIHYAMFYLGLSNCQGGKASIIDSLACFILILLARIIYKEAMTPQKIIGCGCGFLGIVIVNFSGSLDNSFHVNGEGLLLISCTCSAFGSILVRKLSGKIDAVVATGYSLGIGGFLLILYGMITGGTLSPQTPAAYGYLLGLIIISMVGFILYNQLIYYNPIGKIAIFNALIPAFGTIVSYLMLGEPFYIKYVFAIIFISIGIIAVNRSN